jgi:hypothetical protein
MKHGIVVLAAYALAVDAARADNFWSAQVEYSNKAFNSIISPGDTATVRLFANFDADLYAFAAGSLDVIVDDYADAGLWTDFACDLTAPGYQDGNANKGTVGDIFTVQAHSPAENIFADTSNPIQVWHGTFTTTDFTFRDSFILFTETSGFEVYTDADGNSADFTASLTELKTKIRFGIPAPGAAALLLLAGVATRRRPN